MGGGSPQPSSQRNTTLPHRGVNLVPNKQSDSERINAQWSGVLFKPGDASASDASHRIDLNTGSSAVEEMRFGWSPLLDKGDELW